MTVPHRRVVNVPTAAVVLAPAVPYLLGALLGLLAVGCCHRAPAAPHGLDPAPAPQVTLGDLPKPGPMIHMATIQFRSESAALDRAQTAFLAYQAGLLRGAGAVTVEVIGHADDRGEPDYNYRLAERRAAAVAAVYQGVGLAVSHAGLGAYAPLCLEPTWACRRENRRAEVHAEMPDPKENPQP